MLKKSKLEKLELTILKKLSLSSKKRHEINILKLSATRILYYFFTNQYEKILDENIENLNKLLTYYKNNVEALITPSLALNVNEAIQSEKLQINKEQLKILIDQCQSEQFAITLLKSAIDNRLSITSPFSLNNAYCQESYDVKGLTCLRFTDAKKCFFLLQFVSSGDGLFFPEENILITLAHVKQAHVNRLYQYLILNFPTVINYAKSKNNFYGVIASHKRPGHFFYDIWPDLFEIYNNETLCKKIPHLIMREGENYSDLKFLPKHSTLDSIESHTISEICYSQNKWIISIGTNRYLRKDNFCYEIADSFLIEKLLHAPSKVAFEKTQKLKGCYPLVWIGVEGQRRCWLEQIEGYSYILNMLSSRFPYLGVVIDGWTAPFKPSKEDYDEAQKDRIIADKIISQLTKKIPFTLLMGENSHTKIFVGSKVDFFITNFATGSMHISRLLAKPGFCHLSCALSDSSLQHNFQVHPNKHVYLLPKQYVTDIYPETKYPFKDLEKYFKNFRKKDILITTNNIDIGDLSYSIDKNDFYQFIEQRLDKVLQKNEQKRLTLFIVPGFSLPPVFNRYFKLASYNKILLVHAPGSAQTNITNLTRFSDKYLKNHVIYGLFQFGAHARLNMDGDYLVWLRHPLQRIQAHAHQLIKSAEKENKPSDLVSILKAGHKGLDNHYVRLLSNSDAPFGKCTEDMYIAAIKNLKQHFIFIGIVEKLEQSFDRLCTLMDWDRTFFPNEIPSIIQQGMREFSENDTILLNGLIQYDLRLYNEALVIIAKNSDKAISRN